LQSDAAKVPDMTFIERWLASVVLAFLLYPVALVLWHGPDRDFGFGGGIILMMFIQFISPFGLWRVPLAAGTAAAFAWHLFAVRKPLLPRE
jgi:hypothetical protein